MWLKRIFDIPGIADYLETQIISRIKTFFLFISSGHCNSHAF